MAIMSSKGTTRKRTITETLSNSSERFGEVRECERPSSQSQPSSECEQAVQNNGYEAHALSPDSDLHQQIANKAFLLYEASGFEQGHDVAHWLEAERQIKGTKM